MENEIVKFEAGKTYYYRFISSYDQAHRQDHHLQG